VNSAAPGDSPTLEELLGETPVLLNYARRRLRDHHEAEEAVQDCLVAAWQQRGEFARASLLRTWLFGILRHKVLDRLRARRRRPDRPDPSAEVPDDADYDPTADWFDAHGSWKIHPHYAMDALRDCPRQSSLRAELKNMLRLCLDALPETLRRLFALRELDQLETNEAAELAGISAASAPVLLTRARHRLRDCLQRRLASP
jgi:RNA polymerase sigma-70 factor (ECF subfamily)